MYNKKTLKKNLFYSDLLKTLLYICTLIKTQNKMKAITRKLDKDERQEIGIAITNKLIKLGYVPDCTDTNDESEFEVQDMIAEVIKELKLRKKV